MNVNKTTRNCQSGFGLVEIMVGMTIGLILMAGVTQIFLANNLSYRTSEAVSRLQENGRFAIIKLQEDIRMVGYFGCGAGGIGDNSGLVITNNLKPDALGVQQTAFGNFDVGITGVDDSGGGNSDSVTIVRTSNSGIKTNSMMSGTSVALDVSAATFDVGDILLVCDVAQGDIFQMTGPAPASPGDPTDSIEHITGTADDPGNYNPGLCDTSAGGGVHCLSKSYGVNAKVVQMQLIRYWVATGAAGTSALFRSVNGAAGQELVEGVENMQIVYGVDTSGDRAVDRYVDASSVTNWDQVMSARVSLLLTSEQDNITQSAHAYTFDANGNGVIEAGEQGLTTADNRLRHVFTTTINLRNRTK